MTWRELIYMINDELKLDSDDSSFNEEHIAFLAGKYRAFLLKQKYSDLKKTISDSNYQTISLELQHTPAISITQGEACEGSYLRSTIKVPSTLGIGNSRVFPMDYFQGEITYISKDRMRYVGHNKYMKNIIYCAKGPDDYLYFKSSNPQHLYLERVRFSAIFSDAREVSEFNNQGSCDIYDTEFPIEEALVPPLIELVVKELLGAAYRPKDDVNNASDDLANLAAFIQRNTKSALSKQLTE